MNTCQTLKKRRDFLAAAKGVRFHSPRLTAQGLLRQDTSSTLRVGYTITKKVGNAVERNRIKRRFREAVRAALKTETFATLDGHALDCVLIGRREGMTAPFQELVADVQGALRKFVKLKPSPAVHDAGTGQDKPIKSR